MLMSPMGLRPEKGFIDDAQQKTENYRPDFSPERVTHFKKSITI
jgi:hypothetical protein